jgi:hypothetical protein
MGRLRGRRRAIIGLLALAALLELTIGIAVYASGGDDGQTATVALPLHPVAGNFKPDATKVEDCSEQLCFEQAFGNVAYYEGPKRALQLFDARIAESGDGNCHRIAHSIGAASLTRNKGNVATTFAQGSSSCFSGYYHGVLERSLVGVRGYEPERLGRVARGLCDDSGIRNVTWLAYQCLHGLGHGLMITTGYRLPTSVSTCNRLATDWDRTACKGGAFMENISTSYGVRSSWLRDDDPLYPCNAAAERDKLKCYEIVTSRILPLVDWDWEETARMCASIDGDAWASACFRSLGRDVTSWTKHDPTQALELCSFARPYGGEASCVAGVAIATSATFTDGRRAAPLCAASPVDVRGDCYFAIGAVTALLESTPRARAAACRGVTSDPRSRGRCVEGASSIRPLTVG